MAPHRMGETLEAEDICLTELDAMTPKEAKERMTRLDCQLELMQKELRSRTEERAKREERLLAELDTTRKLAELYKEKADEASVKSKDLMSVIKTFESHLRQQEAQYQERLKREVDARLSVEKEAKEVQVKLERQLAEAREEIEAAKAALSAADESARKAAMNGVSATDARKYYGEEQKRLKQGDAAAQTPAQSNGQLRRDDLQARKDVESSREHLFPGESVSEEDEPQGQLGSNTAGSQKSSDGEDSQTGGFTSTTREYPSDPSLPDIKNSIYGTDEFRMYSFKVRPCSRAYSHDWTECPFVHPGENARRRDPRRYHYSCVPCPDFRKGACRRGDNCEYAHGVFECWLHPAQYRTRLCKDGTSCGRRVCFFAHTAEELRPVYTATGSALPSPRTSSPMDMRTVSLSSDFPPMSPSSVLMMSQFSQANEGFNLPTPPMSPSTSGTSMSGSSQWSQSSSGVPNLHLPNGLQASRLRAALHARDVAAQEEAEAILALQRTSAELDTERVAEQLAQLSAHARLAAGTASTGLPSPRNRGGFAGLGLQIPSSPPLDDYYGDTGVLLSPVQSSLVSGDRASQFSHTGMGSSGMPSPTSARRHTGDVLLQQYLEASMAPPPSPMSSGLHGERGGGPSVPLSPSAQQSAVAAALNAQARRSTAPRPSWRDRDRERERDSTAGMGGASGGGPSQGQLTEWGSPTGKPDWGMQQHEDSQVRGTAASLPSTGQDDDSDVPWLNMQRMVKEAREADSEAAAVTAASLAASGMSLGNALAREKAAERDRLLRTMGSSTGWRD